MQTSWQKLVDIAAGFAADHLQLKRFDSDFFEQIDSFANEEELFKIMYMVTPTGVSSEGVDTYTAEVFVLDQIQEGRDNLTSIVSDAHLVLIDFITFVKLSYSEEVDIIGDVSRDSVNNSLLDGLAGAKATITFEVDSIGECDLPLKSKL